MVALNNKKILVTRERSQAQAFIEAIKKRGGTPLVCPLLKIECHCKKIDTSDYEWIFFTSANGVRCFLKENLLDRKIKIAVVGHKTEEALIEKGFKADFIPSVYNAETLAKEFIKQYPKANNLILVRGNKSRKILPDAFERLKLDYVNHIVYETLINYEAEEKLNELMAKQIDYFTFMSPSTLIAAQEMLTEANFELLKKSEIVCIGTTTEKRALQLGCRSVYIPNEFTSGSMLDKISELISLKGRV